MAFSQSGLSIWLQTLKSPKAVWFPAPLTARQNASRRSRAPATPPSISPAASTTPFIAPAEAPVTALISTRPSSSSLSITPHSNAPWAPPPCRARLIGLGAGALLRR